MVCGVGSQWCPLGQAVVGVDGVPSFWAESGGGVGEVESSQTGLAGGLWRKGKEAR